MRLFPHAIVSVFCVCCAASAQALTEGVTLQGGRHVTGGITTDERDALTAARPDRDVRIETVTREGGNCLADARVSISDENGRLVLDTRLDGPWLDVELAPGRFVIDAEFERQPQSRPLTVARDGRRELCFRFDADAESPPGAAPE
jgi:hypothetical protein